MKAKGFGDMQGRAERPALGTLAQRFGGKTGTVRASDVERAEYVAWLQSEGLADQNPYSS